MESPQENVTLLRFNWDTPKMASVRTVSMISLSEMLGVLFVFFNIKAKSDNVLHVVLLLSNNKLHSSRTRRNNLKDLYFSGS